MVDPRQEGFGDGPVHVHQRTHEFAELLDLYEHLQPSRILEIGSYEGGTLYHWLQNAAPGAVLVSVDDFRMGIDNRRLYPEWTPEGVECYAVNGDSHDPETINQVAVYAPFDWVFIDADHSYQAVRHDWETYWPLCKPGGIVAFHDILGPTEQHPEIEVSRLWREIQQAGLLTRELVADPGAPWGGIGVVYLDA